MDTHEGQQDVANVFRTLAETPCTHPLGLSLSKPGCTVKTRSQAQGERLRDARQRNQ